MKTTTNGRASVISDTESMIKQVAKKLLSEDQKRERIMRLAFTISQRYLIALPDVDERMPIDVALGSLYLSCLASNEPITQSAISKCSSRGLIGWPSVVDDINRRTYE